MTVGTSESEHCDLQSPALLDAFRFFLCLGVRRGQEDDMRTVDTHRAKANKQLHPESTHLQTAGWTGLKEHTRTHTHTSRNMMLNTHMTVNNSSNTQAVTFMVVSMYGSSILAATAAQRTVKHCNAFLLESKTNIILSLSDNSSYNIKPNITSNCTRVLHIGLQY